jgi:hypothetical protein
MSSFSVSFAPFRGHVSKDKPANAFIEIRYEDRWYYIENADGVTKRIFAFLLYLFQLQAPKSPSTAPVITVLAG